jgi:hypothetical protein
MTLISYRAVIGLRKEHISILALLTALAAPGARAADVSMQISSRETYVGVPITLRIIIEDVDTHEPPVFPALDNVTVRSFGRPAEFTQTSNINGRVTLKKTLSYGFQLTPREAGRITIPPVVVRADGQQYRTQPIDIVVTKSDTGDLLFVEVKGSRESVYVGEAIDVTLQIWLKPYVDRRRRVKLDEGDMWSRIRLDDSEWGVFFEVLQQLATRRQRPGGREMLREDSKGNQRSYYLYELEKIFWPQRPGQLEVGDISILVSYPTKIGRDDSLFSFFGDLIIQDARPITAQVRLAPIEVKPIPVAGRPSFYRDAVGRFQMTASAKPTEVAVGDPITLTLTVSGSGQLELLQPPPLPKIAALTRGFKVPQDPLAGQVRGDVKVFTQSIRAKSDQVTEIPPIPFAFFDPQREEFVTIRTDPIPLKVKPADTLSVSHIVDAGVGPPVADSLTEVERGIVANYGGIDELLAQQAFSPGWRSMATLGIPPAVWLFGWLIRRRRWRLLHDESYARRRSAKRTALRSVHEAARTGAAASAARLAAAATGYVADRCNLPAGGLTRAEAIEHLMRRGASRELVAELNQFLERCEAMQYAAGASASGDDLAQAATCCINRLEKEHF